MLIGLDLSLTGLATRGGAAIPSPLRDAISALSPTGYWPLNDASGSTTLADVSGNSNNLTVSGLTLAAMPGLTPNEPTSKAVNFANLGQARAASNSVFNITAPQAFSFACVFTLAGERDTAAHFWMCKAPSTGGGYPGYGIVQYTGATKLIQFNVGNDTSNRREWRITAPDTGTYHFALSWNGNPASVPVMYINGVSQSVTVNASAGTPTNLSTTELFALCGRAADGFFHNGLMQHAAIWIGKALTAPEVAGLYTAYSTVDRTRAVPFILDTDGGSTDKDDMAEIAYAIYLHRLGLIDIKAVIATAGDDFSAPACRAILDYYGLTAVPVGAYMGTDAHVGGTAGTPARLIRDAFLPSATRADYSDAATVYGNVLSAAASGSVVVQVGGFTNSLASYLNASAANVTLFNQKTKFVGLTIGQWPNSSDAASPAGNFSSLGAGEYNAGGSDVGAVGVAEAVALTSVIANVTVPVYWHGIEICGNAAGLADLIPSRIPVTGWTTANPLRLGWGTGDRTAWGIAAAICYYMLARFGAIAVPHLTANQITTPAIDVVAPRQGQNTSSAGSSNHYYMTPKLGSLTLAQWRTMVQMLCDSYMPPEI